MIILVTGGAGYIGSHACVSLLQEGHEVVVVDSLINSQQESLRRVEQITGKKVKFYHRDLLHAEHLDDVFNQHHIDAVMHFAGLKAVGESVKQPLRYFHNNLVGTINLLQSMVKHRVHSLVFSSSATVYGHPEKVPVVETSPLQVANPYGRTKLMIEDKLRDVAAADDKWRVALLRYFNPVGAHPSGTIGEHPVGVPNNLFPYIDQVAIGFREKLQVFGQDYPTDDGTCIRDYLHVVDLADGHVKALNYLGQHPGVSTFNLGTGRGISVLQAIQAFETASGIKINYEVVGRRAGDAPVVFADPGLAERELGWKAERSLELMCQDAWRWQSLNPQGFIEQG